MTFKTLLLSLPLTAFSIYAETITIQEKDFAFIKVFEAPIKIKHKDIYEGNCRSSITDNRFVLPVGTKKRIQVAGDNDIILTCTDKGLVVERN